MESSILETVGVEIIGVMSPVSICMLLVVLIVYSLSPSNPFSSAASAPPIRTAANLVYLENTSDSAAQKFEGSLLNALVFVILIAIVTFLLVLLYYYNCTNFLKNYMRFSAFFVLGTFLYFSFYLLPTSQFILLLVPVNGSFQFVSRHELLSVLIAMFLVAFDFHDLGAMGGSIFLSIIQQFSIPIDSITYSIILFNFTIVGVLSVFSSGIPIFITQGYMVTLGIVVATWFTKLPEWTTWSLLVALAVYDLVAVLAPGGPLKMLVELAQSRDEDLPALVYEARPIISPNLPNRGRSLELLVGGVLQSASVEMQPVSGNNVDQNEREICLSAETGIEVGNAGNPAVAQNRDEVERSPLVSVLQERHSISSGSSEYSTVVGNQEAEIVENEEMSPLVEPQRVVNGRGEARGQARRNRSGNSVVTSAGIKLGLGDFIFYSVLVGRAAMYDLMTVYACYLAIISGLGCTLILLSVWRRALPALPISIALGIIFYFLTRLLMEPYIVGTATNLIMF